MTEQTSGEDHRNGETMTAIRAHEYGGPEVLQYESVPRPTPAANELLVEVQATGVNPIDWLVREGYVDEALDPELPYIPGWDLSGSVEAVGDDVSAFDPGEDVFGLVRIPDPGATYAEYAAVPAGDVVRKPETLTHTEAAAVPMVALTAWNALFEYGALQADQRVLIHAAAGGVGHMAVQFADRIGAEVIGTASGSNEAYLRELGVNEFVNYREQAFETVLDDVDLVVDAVGDDVLEDSLDVVAEGGRVVTLPEPPSEAVRNRVRTDRNATVEWFSVEPDAATLETVCEQIVAGDVSPTVSQTWPLSEAGGAHRESQAGHVRGKLVLTVD